jgi:hypothetical protein
LIGSDTSYRSSGEAPDPIRKSEVALDPVEHSTLGGGGVGDGLGLGKTLPPAAVWLALDDATLLAAGGDADTSGRAATVVVPQPVAAIPLIGIA